MSMGIIVRQIGQIVCKILGMRLPSLTEKSHQTI
jgi:hypothetical protein